MNGSIPQRQCYCGVLNLQFGTKHAWDSLKSLKAGLSKTKPAATKQMKHPDGTICKTPEENVTVFCNHCKTLYGRSQTFDCTVLNLLPQNPIVEGCDHVATEEEIRLATLRLKNKAPGDSGIFSQAWKSLLKCDETFSMLKGIVVKLWTNEIVRRCISTGSTLVQVEPVFQIVVKLILFSPYFIFTGILFLQVAYKIIAALLHMRLLPIQESLISRTSMWIQTWQGMHRRYVYHQNSSQEET